MSEKNSAKKTIIGGLFWSFSERMSAQLVSLVVTVVLARLLAPEHYGMISIVTVFITFLDVFVTSGFGNALVQKKQADELDFNSAFVLSFSLSWCLYILLFAVAPLVASFYSMPLLTPVLRVMGLRLPLAAINNIQQAYIQRTMKFKKMFLTTLSGTVVSGVLGVFLAYSNAGVWALVAQYLTNTTVGTIVLFFVGTWKPRLQFSFSRARSIWSFGWKVLMTQLVATLEADIRSLIVGKVFGTADLAYYDQGKKYPALLVTNLNTAIDKVMLPAYSKEQDNRQRVLAMLRRSIRTGVFIITPIMLGFAVVAEPFVKLILTEKWLPAIPYIQIFCLTYLTRPVETSCRQSLLALGKSGTVLMVIIAVNVTALVGTIIAVFALQSVMAVALCSLLATVVSLMTLLLSAGKQLHYSFKMQYQDVVPSLLIGACMAFVVWFVGNVPMGTALTLCTQILAGAVTYIGLSMLFRLEPFLYMWGFVKKIVGKKNG